MFDVWKNVLAEVEQSVPHTTYITYFAGTRLISINDQIVRIGAPNVFIIKQLKQKYNKEVVNALKRNNVSFKSVEYIVESSSHIKKSRGREVTGGEVKTAEVVTKKFATNQKTPKTFGTGLNPSYTLDSFVVGSNNDLAVSIAKKRS